MEIDHLWMICDDLLYLLIMMVVRNYFSLSGLSGIKNADFIAETGTMQIS